MALKRKTKPTSVLIDKSGGIYVAHTIESGKPTTRIASGANLGDVITKSRSKGYSVVFTEAAAKSDT